MPGVPGRDQRTAMERLVRVAAVLKVAGDAGVTSEKLVAVAGFDGDHAADQLDRDLRYLRNQGWQLDNIAPPGAPARYRMSTVDNRFRVRLAPAQQRALQRAVLLVDRLDLVRRLGLPEGERPGDVAPMVSLSAHDQRLTTVIRAVRLHALLRFRYGGKDRALHPESVRFQNERWYLRGLETDGDVVKVFVVQWMSSVTAGPPGSAHRVEAESTLSLHPLGWQVDPPVGVVLRTTAGYQPDVERWLGRPERIWDGGGQIDLQYRITHRAAFRARVYELGLRVRVLSPEAVRREILDELTGMAEERHA